MDGGISGRALNKLTDLKIRAFIRKGEPGRKLSDGAGMFLTLTPARTPVWRIKYRLGGKERLYAVGTYPEVSLEAARLERDAMKAQLRAGHDPVQSRRLSQAAAAASYGHTFEAVAADWLQKRRKDWSEVHYRKSEQALERDIYPRLGKLPVREITPAMVASTIEAIVKRGSRDTAAKILQHVGAVFRLAQARGLRNDNPALPVREVLPARRQTGRMPALLTFPALGGVLRAADAARLSPAVRLAHRLTAFTVARISNVVGANWQELDLESKVPTWTIPRGKMKSKDRAHDHRIILGPTIAEELRKWRQVTGGKGAVFPSPSGNGTISREAIEKAYRVTLDLADKHTPHGWRAAFSTLARDNGFARDVVEITLDHVHDNDVARAYDRGERLEQRVKLMTWWDAELTKAERGGQIVPFAHGKVA